MYDTLPDIITDERVPSMFLTGFSIILTLMIIALVGIAVARKRARRAGIYRKYFMATDRPNSRRIISHN